jgi:uncharacterized membrane protein
MHRASARPRLGAHVECSVTIEAPAATVYESWTCYEGLPALMPSVRRVKQIDPTRILWDVEIAGRQIVWEARVVDHVPDRLVRWYSSAGRPNRGEVRFEAVEPSRADDAPRTRLTVEIEFAPEGPVERLAARFGLAARRIREELEGFARHVETIAASSSDGAPTSRRAPASGRR